VNGRELTSADVKWTFEYWSRTGQFKSLQAAEFAWMFEGMEAIDTPDPYTVVVRFKDPYAPFINYAANEYIPILPHEIYDRDGHFKDRVVGSGAFQLDEAASQKGTRWVWKKNPSYWDTGKPYLDEIRSLVLPDDATAYAAFQAGQVHYLGNAPIPVRDGEQILKKDSSAVGFLYVEPAGREMYMNPAVKPLNDVRVRQAINYAIDRDEFVKVRTDNKGAWALAGSTIDIFTQDEIKKMIPYDLERSKRLLREAGYANGVEIKFQFPTDRGTDEVAEAELLQAQLKKAGINLVLDPMPYEQMSTQKKKLEHTMSLIQRSYSGDIDYALYRIFHPKSKNAYDAIDDAKLVELLEGQRREANPEKRRQIVRDAIKYINVDIALGRALYYLSNYSVWKPFVRNYQPNKGSVADYLTETWLAK
jgi:ABC-type transport system substrate-binding protein